MVKMVQRNCHWKVENMWMMMQEVDSQKQKPQIQTWTLVCSDQWLSLWLVAEELHMNRENSTGTSNRRLENLKKGCIKTLQGPG